MQEYINLQSEKDLDFISMGNGDHPISPVGSFFPESFFSMHLVEIHSII